VLNLCRKRLLVAWPAHAFPHIAVSVISSGPLVGLPLSSFGPAEPIGRPYDRRKLIAVLYADMVGYSRLIGLDDQGTLGRLRALRREIIDPAVDEHGGKIVCHSSCLAPSI
jgi:hypothetical protein